MFIAWYKTMYHIEWIRLFCEPAQKPAHKLHFHERASYNILYYGNGKVAMCNIVLLTCGWFFIKFYCFQTKLRIVHDLVMLY